MSVPLVIVEVIANQNAPRLLAHHCFVKHRWRSNKDVVLFVQIPFNKVRTTIAIFLSFVSFCILCFYYCNSHSGMQSLGFFNILNMLFASWEVHTYSEKPWLRSWKCCPRPSSYFMIVGNILLPLYPVLGYCSHFMPVISSFLASVYFHCSLHYPFNFCTTS